MPAFGKTRRRSALRASLIGFPVAAIIGACSALPLGWMAWQVATSRVARGGLVPDAFHLALASRTLSYSLAVAVVALILALPAAVVLGRGKGWIAGGIMVLVPAVLLMPSIVYSYGWSQVLRLTGVHLELAGRADVGRCIFSLAAWLWPVAAGIIGLSLRRLHPNVQLQALLDGALWRVTARLLLGPAVAAVACITVLATQEFAVYEPTGISVVATEVRTVFETGLYSSPANPITQSFVSGGVPGGAGGESIGAVGLPKSDLPDQAARAGAAVATGLPLLAGVAIMMGIAAWVFRSQATGDELGAGPWPTVLNARTSTIVLAAAVLLLTLGVPIGAMMLSLHRRLNLIAIWRQFSPQITGSVLLASLTGLAALALAAWATVRLPRWAMAVALASFLAGGQLLAIAMIRLYNRPGLLAIYEGPIIVILAYLARFAWLPLLVAGMTRGHGNAGGGWRAVREQAAVDGAGAVRAAVSVILPLAWPMLAACGVLVFTLCLTEVPATVLISPLRPQPLIPVLMTWVHMQRYDDLLEGALLMASVVAALALLAAMLWRVGIRFWRSAPVDTLNPRLPSQRFRAIGVLKSLVLLTMVGSLFSLNGCGDPGKPEAMWGKTGTGPVEFVYPRAIAYSAGDDSFFVIDRMARVQHLSHSGEFLNEWQMPEWRTGKPVGVSVAPNGNVYVPDTHYHRVMVYSPKGELLQQWGSEGTGPGQFIYPTDVAFDKAGRVFVSEYGDNDRIQVFNPDGTFLYAFGHFGIGPGEFSRPQSMVIEGDVVYITDACNHRLVVFKTDGTFLRTMGSTGSDPGQFRYPYGLTMDGQGHLVVCEFGNNRVQLVDKVTGKGLKTWGRAGREPGELAYPWGVAVDKANRAVAVDAGNNRLQVFGF